MKTIIIVILMAALISLSGCVDTNLHPKVNEDLSGTVSVNVETINETRVIITSDYTKVNFFKHYSGKDTYSDGSGDLKLYPNEDNIFIIVNATITNQDYDSFYFWSPGLYLIINNISYHPVDMNQYILVNKFQIHTDIRNSGSLNGNIVYEIPKNSKQYSMIYEQQSFSAKSINSISLLDNFK